MELQSPQKGSLGSNRYMLLLKQHKVFRFRASMIFIHLSFFILLFVPPALLLFSISHSAVQLKEKERDRERDGGEQAFRSCNFNRHTKRRMPKWNEIDEDSVYFVCVFCFMLCMCHQINLFYVPTIIVCHRIHFAGMFAFHPLIMIMPETLTHTDAHTFYRQIICVYIKRDNNICVQYICLWG